MNRREAMRLNRQESVLMALGITSEHAEMLRRISMTLHRWHELECGVDGGWYVERDGTTDKPHMCNGNTGYKSRNPIPDREAGAHKRLDKIMASYPHLMAYVQGDPRGIALYILEKSRIEGKQVDCCYSSQGIAVY